MIYNIREVAKSKKNHEHIFSGSRSIEQFHCIFQYNFPSGPYNSVILGDQKNYRFILVQEICGIFLQTPCI